MNALKAKPYFLANSNLLAIDIASVIYCLIVIMPVLGKLFSYSASQE